MITARGTLSDTVCEEVFEHVPDLELHLEPSHCVTADSPLLFWAETDFLKRFEAAAATDAHIREITAVSSSAQPRLYAINFQGDEATPLFTLLCSEPMVMFLTVTLTAAGCEFCVRAPDKATIARLHDTLTEQHIHVDYQSLYKEAADPTRNMGLTDEQYEALILAYQRGYFAVLRQTDLDELAAELDITGQAVSERLRRALRVLLERVTDTTGQDHDLYQPDRGPGRRKE
ncbi:helix-turn-helix domain-containing protein [Halegenticoccus tardaugens]|uniref:helix-turn-helix domain-containing protein n=1 Tax=Halegenticoccus tardaugens TaxID=2071624 RepID=UPI00100AC317|nr:helix-turn-helix domain-containing protein [Halegenticoccus tardaugens]